MSKTVRLTIAAVSIVGIGLCFNRSLFAGADQGASPTARQTPAEPVILNQRSELQGEWQLDSFVSLSVPVLAADGSMRPVRSLALRLAIGSDVHGKGPTMMDVQLVDPAGSQPREMQMSVGSRDSASPARSFTAEVRPKDGKTWGGVVDENDLVVSARILEKS